MQEEFYALPSELPKIAQLEDVPHYIRISKTVESLIGQNEDLMARLKVNIRQNTLLESQLRDQEQTNRQLKAINSKINSQVEILVEKETLLRQKFDAQDQELEETREFLHKNKITQVELNTLKTYQRRVRTWVRNFISKLQYQIKILRQRNQELENDLVEQQKNLTDFKSRAAEAQRNLQLKEREHQKDKAQLIEDFENRSYNLDHDNQSLTTENQTLKQKLKSFAEVQKQLSIVENRARNFEDKYSDLRKESDKQISELSQKLNEATTQAEMFKLQNESLQKRNAEAEIQNRSLSAKNHEVMSRHEAMNVLWSETQIQRAQLKIKYEEMLRMNRDLTTMLKEQNKMLSKTEALKIDQNIKEIESLMAEIEASILAQND